MAVLIADGVVLTSIAVYNFPSIVSRIIVRALKKGNLVPKSFTNEINKNHLPEFEELLKKGFNETIADEAYEFFKNHFAKIRYNNNKDVNDLLSLAKLESLVRNCELQAQMDSSSSEFNSSERVPYLVLGSYGMSIKDEIACLQRCIKQINKNMKSNGNHAMITENCWARLLSDVTNRKKFLEHCK